MVSRKNNRMITSESTLERDLYMLMEFDPFVESFEEQPLKITYKNSKGGDSTYTPDVICNLRTAPVQNFWIGSLFKQHFVYSEALGKYRLKAMSPEWFLAEVKYRTELFAKLEELKPKLKAGRIYARQQRGKFLIFTETEIRTPVLDNVRFLRRFKERIPNYNDVERILSKIEEVEETTPLKILKLLTNDDNKETARMLPVLWYLTANFRVRFDWFKVLNMRTIISTS